VDAHRYGTALPEGAPISRQRLPTISGVTDCKPAPKRLGGQRPHMEIGGDGVVARKGEV
jgi:hypothetical protein